MKLWDDMSVEERVEHVKRLVEHCRAMSRC